MTAPALPRALRELIQCWEANDPSRAHIYELLDAWPAILAELTAQPALSLRDGEGTAWPVRDVLDVLAKAADHLLFSMHNCDCCGGYERINAARDAARELLAAEQAAQPAPDLEAALERAMRVELCDCGAGAERDREHDINCRILALRSADPHFLERSIAAVLPMLRAERARGRAPGLRRRRRYPPDACRNCGHAPEDHQRLPGHPDGAEECYGSEDCECGHFVA